MIFSAATRIFDRLEDLARVAGFTQKNNNNEAAAAGNVANVANAVISRQHDSQLDVLPNELLAHILSFGNSSEVALAENVSSLFKTTISHVYPVLCEQSGFDYNFSNRDAKTELRYQVGSSLLNIYSWEGRPESECKEFLDHFMGLK